MLFIRDLIWDAWNIGHIARHQVTPEEVEEACHTDFIHRQSYQGRLLLIGPTRMGRMLAVVLAPRDEYTYYVVTARPADRAERRQYEQEKGST